MRVCTQPRSSGMKAPPLGLRFRLLRSRETGAPALLQLTPVHAGGPHGDGELQLRLLLDQEAGSVAFRRDSSDEEELRGRQGGEGAKRSGEARFGSGDSKLGGSAGKGGVWQQSRTRKTWGQGLVAVR